MKIFGKPAEEYILPVKWEILGMVIVVVFQYEGMLRFLGYNSIVARITQWVWMLFVASAVFRLIRKHKFGLRNVIVAGIIFSFIIHGLKAFVFRVFFWPYDMPADAALFHLLEKFLYGSALVMAVSLAVWMCFSMKGKGWLSK